MYRMCYDQSNWYTYSFRHLSFWGLWNLNSSLLVNVKYFINCIQSYLSYHAVKHQNLLLMTGLSQYLLFILIISTSPTPFLVYGTTMLYFYDINFLTSICEWKHAVLFLFKKKKNLFTCFLVQHDSLVAVALLVMLQYQSLNFNFKKCVKKGRHASSNCSLAKGQIIQGWAKEPVWSLMRLSDLSNWVIICCLIECMITQN